MTDHIRRLERIGHAAWPSLEDEWRDGWLLRAGGGVTRRSNSANPVHEGANLDAQIDYAESWFERRGLPAIVRLTEAADPDIDRRLEASGYRHDLGAVIMTRSVEEIAASVEAAQVAQAPSPAWLDLMAEEPGRGGAKQAVLFEMLDKVDRPAGYAGVGGLDRLDAIGLGVVVDDHIALFMMRTREQARRRGLARTIAAALMNWGTRHGAREAFLQVHPANAPAIALYESLGFHAQYEYWYRERP